MRVTVMSNDEEKNVGIELAPGVVVHRSALRYSYARSSGPGGQNANKTSTKVRLHVELSAIKACVSNSAVERLIALAGSRITRSDRLVITDEHSRSQFSNRQACRDRLRALLVEATKPVRKRRKTKRSYASKQKRLTVKKQRSETKRQRKRPRMDD